MTRHPKNLRIAFLQVFAYPSYIALAVLFGLTTAMIAYLVKQRRVAAAGQNIAISSGALASGVLGVGCAACGSLILGVALPSLGAAGALAALPLNGEEFGILSVVLFFASLLLISKNIAESIREEPVALTAHDSSNSPALRTCTDCRTRHSSRQQL